MLNSTRSFLITLTAQILLMAFCMVGTAGNAEVADAGKIAVKNGAKIAFMGDSITAAGRRPGGYCQLVLSALKDQGI